jgi:hypothetical protein
MIGLGLYRGPDAIPQDLEPGQPPHPSEGREGPPIAEPVAWEQTRLAIDELGRAIASQGFDYVAGNATGQTDSDGIATVGLYQVAAGIEAQLHRLTGNALVAATGLPYTPAVPYSNAAAYFELFAAETPRSDALSNAGLLDFGPPAAGGAILPFLITDMSMQASFVRGPMWFVAYVKGGPASTSLTFRYQIALRRERGIA